jgi:hypothetical protein
MGDVGLHDQHPGIIDLRGFPSKGFRVQVRWKAKPQVWLGDERGSSSELS